MPTHLDSLTITQSLLDCSLSVKANPKSECIGIGSSYIYNRFAIMAKDDQAALDGIPKFISFTKTWHNKPYPFISPNRPELSVAGKNVVVAGGGTGIGKATAIAFAQAGAASVSMLGRRVERLESAAKEIHAAGANASVFYERADMANRAEAEAALNKLASKVGKIDVFIWSAGIAPEMAEVKGYSESEFRRGWELIVMGAFNAIQAVLPLAAPDAKVFNISTGISHINPIKGIFNYAVTKMAVAKMFDYVAAENPNLHVVNIQPGVVATELNSYAYKQDERKFRSLLHGILHTLFTLDAELGCPGGGICQMG